MTEPRRIYLDNAATSWPKPDEVYAAVDDYQRRLGAPAGRGAYAEASETERLIDQARRGVADLLGVREPARIAFTLNGSDALNTAIHGLVRPGDHVVTTVVEHNSVLRPLRLLEETQQVRVTRLPCDTAGRVDPAAFAAALREGAALAILTHASNVTGALQPAAEVGALCREHGVPLLLDAAQTLGRTPIDVAALGCDLLAAPGHKGLLGPLGTGVLYVGPQVEERLRPLRQGGTGSRSDDDRQPDELPDRFEAGNLNVPGIVGLGAGAAYVAQRGVAAIAEHEQRLTALLWERLSETPELTLHGPPPGCARVGVVALQVAQVDPREVAAMLDAAARVQVRAGFHCAPLVHRALGTADGGGLVRLSVGPFNTVDDIHVAADALRELAAAMRF